MSVLKNKLVFGGFAGLALGAWLTACGSSGSDAPVSAAGSAGTAGSNSSGGSSSAGAGGKQGAAGSSKGGSGDSAGSPSGGDSSEAGAGGDTASAGTSSGGSANGGSSNGGSAGAAGSGGTGPSCTPVAEPGNLLINGSFHCDISHWSGGPTLELAWDASDAGGKKDSGSIQLTSRVSQNLGFGQCVSVSAAKKYQYSVQAYIPAAATKPGAIYAGIVWFTAADCAGATGLATTTQVAGTDVRDTWQTLTFDTPFQPPATAVSANIYAKVINGFMETDTIDFNPRWDNFVFSEVK